MPSMNFLRWSLRTLTLFALVLSGCGGSDSGGGGATAPPDTFTVSIDGGTATSYTETAAANPYGYDPLIVAWRDTGTDQIHLFVAEGIGATVDFIVAVTFEPSTATGTSATLHEVRYEYNWDMSTDPVNIDDVFGTVDVQTSATSVGDVVEGTYTGFHTFSGGPILSLDGSFRATRGVDDWF